jgi:hypothetical protein
MRWGNVRSSLDFDDVDFVFLVCWDFGYQKG